MAIDITRFQDGGKRIALAGVLAGAVESQAVVGVNTIGVAKGDFRAETFDENAAAASMARAKRFFFITFSSGLDWSGDVVATPTFM